MYTWNLRFVLVCMHILKTMNASIFFSILLKYLLNLNLVGIMIMTTDACMRACTLQLMFDASVSGSAVWRTRL